MKQVELITPGGNPKKGGRHRKTRFILTPYAHWLASPHGCTSRAMYMGTNVASVFSEKSSKSKPLKECKSASEYQAEPRFRDNMWVKLTCKNESCYIKNTMEYINALTSDDPADLIELRKKSECKTGYAKAYSAKAMRPLFAPFGGCE